MPRVTSGSVVKSISVYRPLALFVGLRYLRAKRRTQFVSFITLVSLLGIAIGVAALIVILSVMNGFEHELRTRLLSMSSHATVTAAEGALADWSQLTAVANDFPGVEGAAPYIEIEALLGLGPNLTGAVVRGILPDQEKRVSEIGSFMRQGELEALTAGSGNLILGRVLAINLGAQIGDRVTVMIPGSGAEGVLRPRLRRFTLSGVFEAGLQDHDGVLALVHLEDAAALKRLADEVSGIRLRVDDVFAAPVIVAALSKVLPPGLRSTDWTRDNATYFRAIRIEKTMMSLILLLIVAVAAFNIVASLVMVVIDKRTEIAIFRTMGMSPGSVVRMFMVQGLFIGWAGTVLGVLGGVWLALNVGVVVPFLEGLFGFHIMDPSVYYVTDIPSELHRNDVLIIAVVALVLTLLATIYPSLRAAKTEPAQALRYE